MKRGPAKAGLLHFPSRSRRTRRAVVTQGLASPDPRRSNCDSARAFARGSPPSCASPMIRLVDVHKSFGPKRVLDGFTLDVDEGETMVIIGYSGTGKSVAIKHIVGLLEPDSGEGWVEGLGVDTLQRCDLYRLQSRLGYVFQFAALFDSYSIGENVSMGLRKQRELSESE